MNRKKEIAKFFSGLAANQIMTHGSFILNDVSFSLFGIMYTQRLNTFAVAFWSIVLVFLIHYAWFKKG